jgi:hypothetical protein
MAMVLPKMHEEFIPLRDIIMAHSSADEIKIAQSRAQSRWQQAKFSYNWEEYIQPSLLAFSVPLVFGSLSIGMREGLYRDNPSQNWMGSVNFAFSVSMAVTTLYIMWTLNYLIEVLDYPILSEDLRIGYFGLVGIIGVLSLLASIHPAVSNPFIGDFYNNTPVMYYLPTAMSAIAATFYVIKLRF